MLWGNACMSGEGLWDQKLREGSHKHVRRCSKCCGWGKTTVYLQIHSSFNDRLPNHSLSRLFLCSWSLNFKIHEKIRAQSGCFELALLGCYADLHRSFLGFSRFPEITRSPHFQRFFSCTVMQLWCFMPPTLPPLKKITALMVVEGLNECKWEHNGSSRIYNQYIF